MTELRNNLPLELIKLVNSFIPDIIIDGTGYKQNEVSNNMLFNAKIIYFYDTFRLENHTHLANIYHVSGVPIIAATSLENLFKSSQISNSPDIGLWDISNVKKMTYMFKDATKFNDNLSKWNVSDKCCISHMFTGAKSFDRDLNCFDTSNMEVSQFTFAETAIHDKILIRCMTIQCKQNCTLTTRKQHFMVVKLIKICIFALCIILIGFIYIITLYLMMR